MDPQILAAARLLPAAYREHIALGTWDARGFADACQREIDWQWRHRDFYGPGSAWRAQVIDLRDDLLGRPRTGLVEGHFGDWYVQHISGP